MNCKPGDLAIYVGSCKRDCGKVVRVTHLSFEWVCQDGSIATSPAWFYEGGPLTWDNGMRCKVVGDEVLRPIRDNDKDDETLTWAGKPVETC